MRHCNFVIREDYGPGPNGYPRLTFVTCGQTVGVRVLVDVLGGEHACCPRHADRIREQVDRIDAQERSRREWEEDGSLSISRRVMDDLAAFREEMIAVMPGVVRL